LLSLTLLMLWLPGGESLLLLSPFPTKRTVEAGAICFSTPKETGTYTRLG
jgi:hypothetical protein